MAWIRLIALAAASAAWLFEPALAQTSPDDEVLFAPTEKRPVIGSKFGALADFQAALLDAALACGFKVKDPGTWADGKLGLGTIRAIQHVSQCDKYRAELGATPAAQGVITVGLWKLVGAGTPIPGPLARSFIMSHGAEGTDYPVVEFNVGTTDKGILTWGPQGATVGQAHQVQQILEIVDREIEGLIDTAFAGEASEVRLLIATRSDKKAEDLITKIKGATIRANLWLAGFKTLGEDARVRAIYDRLMINQGKAGIRNAVTNFYKSYWAHSWCPTEADLGFFIDRAIQITVYAKHTAAATADVAEVEATSIKPFSPAQRRRAIAANFWAGDPVHVGDRLSRDVAYYIDGIATAELTNESLLSLVAKRGGQARSTPAKLNDEVGRWTYRINRSASAYGLSERTAPVPYGLEGEPAACAAARK